LEIYQEGSKFFIRFTGQAIVHKEDHTLQENEAAQLFSGERIVVMILNKGRIGEYMFSSELSQT